VIRGIEALVDPIADDPWRNRIAIRNNCIALVKTVN
jgi:hypothetical protein